jgi:hypothetical protein
MYEHDALLVAGKAPGHLDYHVIVRLGSFEAIKNHIAEQVFRRLEMTRGSSSLLDKILENTEVSVPPATERRAMMYVEARISSFTIAEESTSVFSTSMVISLRPPRKLAGVFN